MNIVKLKSVDINAKNYFYDAAQSLMMSKNGEEKLISKDYIKVIGLIRNQEDSDWAILVEFKNMNGELKQIHIPCKMLLWAPGKP